MKLHEYQAKNLLRDYGLPVSTCYVAHDADEAINYAQRIGGSKWVLKIQVHSGLRCKNDGVAVVSDYSEIEIFCAKWVGQRFICPETTDNEGLEVSAILIERFISFEDEYYISLTVDREKAAIALIIADQGGINITDAVDSRQATVHKIALDLLLGSQPFQVRQLSQRIGFNDEQTEQLIDITNNLVRLFIEKDLLVLEINPFVIRKNGRLHFLDAKIETDDNANYRHPELVALKDTSQGGALHKAAAAHSFSCWHATGDIGCIVNGMSLSMAIMDTVRHQGSDIADLLDIGGCVNTADHVQAACRILLANKHVSLVLVSVFTGFSSCLTIAKALRAAMEEAATQIPFVVCLSGFESQEAHKFLRKNKCASLHIEEDLASAIQRAVSFNRTTSTNLIHATS